MTDNPNRIPFKDMPREDQDRIAGAIARGDDVEFWAADWCLKSDKRIFSNSIYRIPPAPKPAKDPNRPRPAHKLNLKNGDLVKCVGYQDGSDDRENWAYVVGRSGWIQGHIDTPPPKASARCSWSYPARMRVRHDNHPHQLRPSQNHQNPRGL